MVEKHFVWWGVYCYDWCSGNSRQPPVVSHIGIPLRHHAGTVLTMILCRLTTDD
jgi:hypothetical protein